MYKRSIISLGSTFLINNYSNCEYKINNVQNNNNNQFYKKNLNCDGIIIKGSENVNNQSFIVACERIQKMLRHTHKNVKKNLLENELDYSIIGINESITDLPEHNHMKNKIGGYSGRSKGTIDNCRGMRHGSTVFCSEENLINQGSKSKYSENIKDIFIHESAHGIMAFGLDKDTKTKIYNIWDNAKKSGLWNIKNKNAYALSNSGEYFAELSMWYYGGHGDFLNKDLKIPNLY